MHLDWRNYNYLMGEHSFGLPWVCKLFNWALVGPWKLFPSVRYKKYWLLRVMRLLSQGSLHESGVSLLSWHLSCHLAAGRFGGAAEWLLCKDSGGDGMPHFALLQAVPYPSKRIWCWLWPMGVSASLDVWVPLKDPSWMWHMARQIVYPELYRKDKRNRIVLDNRFGIQWTTPVRNLISAVRPDTVYVSLFPLGTADANCRVGARRGSTSLGDPNL